MAGSTPLQVAAVFVAQEVYAELGCPKGLGLRLLRDLLAAGAASKDSLLQWNDSAVDKRPIQIIREVTFWLTELQNTPDEEDDEDDD